MTTNYGTNPETQSTGFVGEVWSQLLNKGLNKSCVMLKCVNRSWQAEAEKGAEVINIINPDNVTVAPYEGEIEDYGAMTSTTLELKLNQNVSFGLVVPDIDQAQSNVSIQNAIINKAQSAVDAAIDEYIFSMYANAHTDNKIGSLASPVALYPSNIYKNFVALAKKLKNSGALTSGNHGWVVVNPAVEEVLLLSSEFTSASQLGADTLQEGAIGRIAGLDVYVSANVGALADSKYVIFAGTTDAITYASQLKKVESLRSQTSFASIVRGLYTFGALVLEPKAIATVTCTASVQEPEGE